MKATLPATKQQAFDILSECCQQGVSARVVSPYCGLSQSGKLVSADPEQVIIRVPNGDNFETLNDDLCCVIFDYKDRPHVFLSAIIGVSGRSASNIAIAIPEDIAAAERRHIDRF